jgi:replicative DNA helicase
VSDVPPFDRSVPHNREAERAILGAILVQPAAFTAVAEVLFPEDLFRQAHRTLHAAMGGLATRDVPIDGVTLTAELTKTHELEARWAGRSTSPA